MKEARYSVVMADPPWAYHVDARTDQGRTSASHYKTMPLAELRAMSPQIDGATRPRCAMFLWVTSPNLPAGLELLGAWGFKFTTIAFVWHKLNKLPIDDRNLALAVRKAQGPEAAPLTTYHGRVYRTSFGLGHYTRGGAEVCLLGTRGQLARAHRDVEQVIHAPVREHSRKPDEAYERIERLYQGETFLELFARQKRPGWAAHGDEKTKFEAGTP